MNRIYYMKLGAELHEQGIGFDTLKILDQILYRNKRLITEYRQQCNNIANGEGILSGKYITGDFEPFIKRKIQIMDKIKSSAEHFLFSFDSDGEVLVDVAGVEINLNEYTGSQ